MKISKNSASPTSYTSGTSAYGKTRKVQGAPPVTDSVEVSESGSLFQAAVAVAEKTPDIRTGAIEGIQEEFADGSYHRDETEVAEKVIQDYTPSS